MASSASVPYLEPAQLELLRAQFVKAAIKEIVPQYIPPVDKHQVRKQTHQGFLYYLMVFSKDLQTPALSVSSFRLRQAQLDAPKLKSLLDTAFRQALAGHPDTQGLLEDRAYMDSLYTELLEAAVPYLYLTTDAHKMLHEPRYRPVLVVYVATMEGRPVPWVMCHDFLHPK